MTTTTAPRVVVASTPGHRTFGRVLPPLLVLIVVIIVWHLASSVVLSRGAAFLLPPPSRVVRAALFDADNRRELASGIASTALVAASGFLIASVIGLAVAIAMNQSRWIHRAVYPYLVIIDTVPTLAIVPLIGFSLGYGFRSQVVVCVLVGLFPMVNNATFGFRSLDPALIDLFRMQRCGRLGKLRHLDLPGALPSIATGLRISAPLAVIAAVVSDFFFRSGDPGIGRLIFLYRRNLSSEMLIAAVIVAALLGLAFLAVVNALIALLMRARGKRAGVLSRRRPSPPTAQPTEIP